MKSTGRSGTGTLVADFPVSDRNRDIEERTRRLREIVNASGGPKAVSARSGVALGTLNKYLAGRDMPVANLVRLADACRIRVEWLARGYVEPTMPNVAAADTAPGGLSIHRRLFSSVNIDKLAEALEAVLVKFGPGKVPQHWGQILQATILVYDLMQEADEPGSNASRNVPQGITASEDHD